MNTDENIIYSEDSLIVTDDEIFPIKVYSPMLTKFEPHVAYIQGEYFYIYRGEKTPDDVGKELIKFPGIYINPDDGKSFLVEPVTDEDKAKYTHADKVSNVSPEKIINMINTKEKVLVTIPDSNKSFLPTISNDDDVLKRCVKKALIEKNIDIDQYKHRFIDKNALFNFKQVIKGNSKLSMLLFDRGCEALNLKYTIIVEENDKDNCIGNPLTNGKIVVSSDDTHDGVDM